MIETLLKTAISKGVMIATAESCTGGLVAGALTEIPGSSAMFDRGFVTYTNAAKMQMLGVSADTLDTYGAVSEQVAAQMAQGACKNSNAQLSVAITGIAGPGGSDHKPEGRVCFGWCMQGETQTETIEFGAIGRAQVRAKSVEHALSLLGRALDS
ncbi:CinA family protein [Aestuariibius sp. HNIBRBA575]|uniref:CinA family protein n=1 Tax=Aestuariibius sp. HNIBRBA575 TaxID=3233343 RepID=UPI0034A3B895